MYHFVAHRRAWNDLRKYALIVNGFARADMSMILVGLHRFSINIDELYGKIAKYSLPCHDQMDVVAEFIWNWQLKTDAPAPFQISERYELALADILFEESMVSPFLTFLTGLEAFHWYGEVMLLGITPEYEAVAPMLLRGYRDKNVEANVKMTSGEVFENKKTFLEKNPELCPVYVEKYEAWIARVEAFLFTISRVAKHIRPDSNLI